MDEDTFQAFVNQAPWRFAKSIPNWPHFYIVEEELPDQAAYQKARAFIQDSGRDGRFYDMQVRYYDMDGWTYWSSPLVETIECRYMINRCRTEYTYEYMRDAGKLPDEGFTGEKLDISSILNDPDFRSLVAESEGSDFSFVDVPGTAEYLEHIERNTLKSMGRIERQREILRNYSKIFHALEYLFETEYVKQQCDDSEMNMLQSILAAQRLVEFEHL